MSRKFRNGPLRLVAVARVFLRISRQAPPVCLTSGPGPQSLSVFLLRCFIADRSMQWLTISAMILDWLDGRSFSSSNKTQTIKRIMGTHRKSSIPASPARSNISLAFDSPSRYFDAHFLMFSLVNPLIFTSPSNLFSRRFGM